MNNYKKIGIKKFLSLLGDTEKDFIKNSSAESYENFLKVFYENPLRYRSLTREEEKSAILQILKKIDADTQKIAEPYRVKEWEDGWNENYTSFAQSKDFNDLTPKFTRVQNLVRFDKNIIYAESEFFEKTFVKVLQNYLIYRYFSNYKNMYEFGCGSCINIIETATKLPNINLHGTDFVAPPVNILRELNSNFFKNRIESSLFDMMNPDYNLKIKENSCILTSGAIEQLASKYDKFIDYLLLNKPDLCIHIEPIYEFYSDDTLLDFVTKKFHSQRNYSSGLYNKLKELEKDEKINVITANRTSIGSLNMEGYNIIVWRVT